jgi:hypothetical protein
VKAKFLLKWSIFILLLCGAARPCAALDLWGTTSGSGVAIQINQIDISTGAVFQRKTIAIEPSAASLEDFASDPIREPTVLWGVRWSGFGNTSHLVAIEPYQNLLLSSVQLSSPTAIQSIAIDPTTGILYGAGGTSLYRITRDTGAASLVGTSSASLDEALGFDAAGNLYGIASNNVLVAVDKSTAATTTVATLNARIEDLAAHPGTGSMYALGLGPQLPDYGLYQINLTTGALSNVGISLSRPASLAFTYAAIPEPTSVCLIAIAFYFALGQSAARLRR